MIVLQAGLSLVLCVACAYWLTAIYVGGALAVSIVCIVLLLMNWNIEEEQDSLSKLGIEFVYRVILGLAIGAIWPSLPIIFASKRSHVARPSNTSD